MNILLTLLTYKDKHHQTSQSIFITKMKADRHDTPPPKQYMESEERITKQQTPASSITVLTLLFLAWNKALL